MTAYVSNKTGNWSDPTMWTPNGTPGSGDTISIGAHTCTVDSSRTIGTSPNDNTTKVIDITNGAGRLSVGVGVTLTVLGNRGGVHTATFEQLAGSSVVFDASASGGTPIYKDISGGALTYLFSGSSGSRCSLSAVSGQTFALCGAWVDFTANYANFTRCSTPGATNAAFGSVGTSIQHCQYDNCANINITQSSATLDFIFSYNQITNSTDAADSFKFILDTSLSSGRRAISYNASDKQFNNLAKDVSEFRNNALGGISCFTGGVTTFLTAPVDNFFGSTLNLNGGDGMKLVGNWDGLYVAREGTGGNPHYLAPYAIDGADATYQRVIFESQMPDLIDTGDCFLCKAPNTAGGKKIIAKNCIMLPSGYTGDTVMSGQMFTGYSPTATANDSLFESYRGTGNVTDTTVVGVGPRAMFAFSEGASGAAGNVPALKSNLAWSSASNQGRFAERISGTTLDVITASDYNWLWNVSAGDNLRGYEDHGGNGTLWTAGDAVAAGIDTHQGSGDPGFVDSTRNVAKWCAARGYGAATYAAGKAALQADPTRVTDLIRYVFEGFKPTNAAMRNAAHDGGCVGAANWHKTRTTTNAAAIYAAAATKFGVA